MPLILAAFVYTIMYIWHRGVLAMTAMRPPPPLELKLPPAARIVPEPVNTEAVIKTLPPEPS